MHDSVFDPTSFLQTEIAGAHETRSTPVPEGEYRTIIGSDEKSVTARLVTLDDGNKLIFLELMHKILEPSAELVQLFGRDEIQVRQSIRVDIEPNGAISFGPNRNVQLGRLREAVGQNDPKKAWSFLRLRGAGPMLSFIKNRPDKNDPSVVYSEVSRVSKL